MEDEKKNNNQDVNGFGASGDQKQNGFTASDPQQDYQAAEPSVNDESAVPKLGKEPETMGGQEPFSSAIQTSDDEDIATSDVEKTAYGNESVPSSEPINIVDNTMEDTAEGGTVDQAADNTVMDSEVTQSQDQLQPEPMNDSNTMGVSAPVQAIGSKSHKKGRMIALLIAALIIIGGVIAYFFWFQSPNKVVMDGIMNSMAANSATYNVDVKVGGDSGVNFNIAGGINKDVAGADLALKTLVEGKEYTVKGGGIFESNGTAYIKVENVSSLVSSLIGDSYSEFGIPESASKSIKNFTDKISDKWIKVSSEDMKSISAEASTIQGCLGSVIGKINSDKKITNEIIELYKKNQFVNVSSKLGENEGSLGYKISGDGVKLKEFLTGMKSTSVYKELGACNVPFDYDEEDLKVLDKEEPTNTTMELWVDKFSHTITSIKFESGEGENKIVSSIGTKFNETFNISKPTEFITVKELQADITKLQTEIMGAMTADYEFDARTMSQSVQAL